MLSSNKKISIRWVVVTLSLALFVGCSSVNSSVSPPSSNATPPSSTTGTNPNTKSDPNASSDSTNTNSSSILYNNTQYGFNFTLPKSWQGFTIVTENWQGNDVTSGKVTETGLKFPLEILSGLLKTHIKIYLF